MNLKVGIIIIGSLLWDNSKKRKYWRRKSLNKIRTKIKLPIQYGRISSSRVNTFTMVYSSKLKKEEYGQGVIVEFRNRVTNIKQLEGISENTIRVERDKTKEEWKLMKKEEPFILNWNWGVLGLCINPKHKLKNSYSKEIIDIVNFWGNSLVNFNPERFSLNGEPLIIDKNGIFEINWTEELADFDFLISTMVEPNTKNGEYPNARRIAQNMYEGNYYTYFIKNIKNKIYTKDDGEIIELIKSEYCVLNYLKSLKLAAFLISRFFTGLTG